MTTTKVTPTINLWLDEVEEPVIDRYDAMIDGENVGYLCMHPATDGGWWIKSLKVKAGFRGQGIARYLLSYVIDRLGGEELSLRAKPYADSPLTTEELMRFYGSFGFEQYDDNNRMRRLPT